MLNKDLISPSIPTLAPNDTVSHALELMNDYHISHLPVVEDPIFLGIVNENDLLNEDGEMKLSDQAHRLLSLLSVRSTSHFTEAVKICTDFNLSIIPVVEDQTNWVGSITKLDLLKSLARMMGVDEPGGIIVLELEERSFSFSEISKLVETNDAAITQLNTYLDREMGTYYVTLKINKFEISDIIATFQRYEYHVKYYFGEEIYENELKANYDHLMNYLSI